MDIFIRDQMIPNNETGKWEVNDSAVASLNKSSLLSYVFGSNFIEGDNLMAMPMAGNSKYDFWGMDGYNSFLGGDQQADNMGVWGLINFATGESLDSYLGDALELMWAREDVDIVFIPVMGTVICIGLPIGGRSG